VCNDVIRVSVSAAWDSKEENPARDYLYDEIYGRYYVNEITKTYKEYILRNKTSHWLF